MEKHSHMGRKKALVGQVISRPAAVATGQTLPPIVVGSATPQVSRRVEKFYASVADIFERWVVRRDSHHTQRAYRGDVMAFVRFAGMAWPEEATQLLGAGVDIRKVQELLGHRYVTTTQIYDKRRLAVSESASHDVPI